MSFSVCESEGFAVGNGRRIRVVSTFCLFLTNLLRESGTDMIYDIVLDRSPISTYPEWRLQLFG